MKVFVFILAFLFLAGLIDARHPIRQYGDIWTSCGSASDHLTIKSVVISPDPPQKGTAFTVKATGTLDETITNSSSATVTISISYGVIPLFSTTQNLCNVLAQANKQDPQVPTCPVAAGTITIATPPITIPSDAPDGSYSGQATVNDQNGQQVTCVNVDLSLSSLLGPN